jgi:hypothetical protein
LDQFSPRQSRPHFKIASIAAAGASQSKDRNDKQKTGFFDSIDPKQTTQDRKLMVKAPRTNGGPGSLSCWKGRSTAEPFHYRSLGFGRPRSI